MAGCVPLTDPIENVGSALLPLPASPSLDVLVLGDWGTGGSDQVRMAQLMAVIHRAQPPAFVITVGDNFYPKGVESVEDELWAEVFEGVYAGRFWEPLTFRPTLGNHDYRGNPDAQVAYSARNPRWQMPARYYDYEVETPDGGRVLFLALDTDPIDDEDEEDFVEQIAWLEERLRTADHDWIIAYGHHPIETDGLHGLSEGMWDEILPRLAGRVTMLIAGHQHSTEIREIGGTLTQAVCGGAAGSDNDYRIRTRRTALVAFSGGGWCSLKLWKDTLALELYDGKGALRYRLLRTKGPAGPAGPAGTAGTGATGGTGHTDALEAIEGSAGTAAPGEPVRR